MVYVCLRIRVTEPNGLFMFYELEWLKLMIYLCLRIRVTEANGLFMFTMPANAV